jgi:uncharacterized membrane protein
VFDIALVSVHVASTALYLGGAVTMELVLRYAQRELPGPQTAVTCQVSGRIWRWWAQAALVVAGATFIISATRAASPAAVLVVYLFIWCSLGAVLTVMSYRAHPALARKVSPDASFEERSRSRDELKKAIATMDRLLRAELGLATLLTVVSASYVEVALSPGIAR